jgi:hypothetical protein
MENNRTWTWEIYIITFIATALIFLSGAAIGYYFSSTTANPMALQIDSANDNMLNMQLLLNSESDPELFCSMYRVLYQKFDNETWSIGERLEYLEQNKKAFDPSIKFKYYQLEYRDMLMAKKAVEVCNESIENIIYIYSNNEGECPMCKEQGKELWYLRNAYQNSSTKIRIYSFDGSSAENSMIVGMLKQAYGFASYPTMIINGRAYGKFMTEQEIKDKIE